MKEKKASEQKSIEGSHYEVFQLRVPRKFYPKVKGNKSNAFAEKIEEILRRLHDIEIDLELQLKNIKALHSILDSLHKKKRPIKRSLYRNLGSDVNKFLYEYENYCLRVYIYRETLTKFIANFFNIKKNDHFYNLLDDSLMKKLGITKSLSKFDNGILKEIIEYRNRLTHRLESEKNNHSEEEFSKFLKELSSKTKYVNKSLEAIRKTQEEVAQKICEYKELK